MATKTRFSKDQLQMIKDKAEAAGVTFSERSTGSKVFLVVNNITYAFGHFYSADDFLNGVDAGEKKAHNACHKICQEVRNQYESKERELNRVPKIVIQNTGKLWCVKKDLGGSHEVVHHPELPAFRMGKAVEIATMMFGNKINLTVQHNGG